ncbi:MAG: cytochrome c maturation protein CcmE [Gammaproteobacteria bacterium]|nr:cytochrome c maturation protein CcmE [Gammaproteobacteria bacterium]
MKARNKRFMFVVVGLSGLAVAVGLVLNALNSNVSFFYSPTQVQANEAPQDKTIRLGGMVEEGSLKREDDGLTVHFNVTDNLKTVSVTYKGILPDLFSEGQGVVAQGKLDEQGGFYAKEVLAKHDESYMPPEVQDALEKAEETKKQQMSTTSLMQ